MGVFWTYDGQDFRRHATGDGHDVRWAAWRPDGQAALLVGNGGSTCLWAEGRCLPLPAAGRQNLRGAGWSPDGAQALLVGNQGQVWHFDGEGLRRLAYFSPETLRRVAWHPDGAGALAVGNAGLALWIEAGRVEVVGWGEHHLRDLAWSPDGSFALIAADRGLYRFRAAAMGLEMLHEEPEGDLMAVDWHPAGSEALVAGCRSYGSQPLEREGLLYRYRFADDSLVMLGDPERAALWTGVSWNSSGQQALLVSNHAGLGPASFLAAWDGQALTRLWETSAYRLTGVAWQPGGQSSQGLDHASSISSGSASSTGSGQALLWGSPRAAFWSA